MPSSLIICLIWITSAISVTHPDGWTEVCYVLRLRKSLVSEGTTQSCKQHPPDEADEAEVCGNIRYVCIRYILFYFAVRDPLSHTTKLTVEKAVQVYYIITMQNYRIFGAKVVILISECIPFYWTVIVRRFRNITHCMLEVLWAMDNEGYGEEEMLVFPNF